MGFGDVKLLGVIGAFLGADACMFVLMLAAAVGSLVGAVVILCGRRGRHALLPFGPFLALGALAWMLCGPELVTLYGGLLVRLLYGR